MIKDSRLAGLNCIGQIRCSRKIQARKSIPQQKVWLRQAAAEQEMHYVDDMSEAISASQILKRPDIQRIFDRKRIRNDFNAILLQDLSRLTRGGAEHGLEIYFRLKSAGIKLVTITDGLIDGDEKLLEASRRFQESRAQAKATAMVGRRGAMYSQESKRMSYSLQIPFGIDRMITDLTGNPKCRIRRISRNVSQKLSPDGSIVIQTFLPDEEGNATRYLKQIDEIEDLVPGSQIEVDFVNMLYRRYFIDGVRIWSLTREANDLSVPTRTGVRWTQDSVRYILRNPVYLGVAYSNRTTNAMFWMNGANNTPIEARKLTRNCAYYRPIQDWKMTTYESLNNLITLDSETKVRIQKWQLSELQRVAERKNRKRGGDRHVNSQYMLKGIMRDSEDKVTFYGHTMLKRPNGNKREWRYYKSCNQVSKPKRGSYQTHMVNADALEPPVKAAVKELLANYQGLEEAVKAACDEYRKATRDRTDDKLKLEADRQHLLAEIAYWVEQLAMLGKTFVDSKVQPLLKSVAEVEARIRSIESIGSLAPAEKYAKQLADAMQYMVAGMDNFSPMEMNRVLRVLISRMEIDLKTQRVEIDLNLPSWAGFDGDVKTVCVENGTFETRNFQTCYEWGIDLGQIVCQKVNHKTPCFTCSRTPPPLPKAA